MVFYFQPLELVAEPLGCCQSRFSLGSSFQLGLRLIKLMAAKVNSCSFFQVETQETHRPAARGLLRFPNRSVFLRFAQSRRRPLRRGARSVEKASLSSVQLSAFAFPLKLYCKALLSRHLPLSEPIARTAVAAGKLLWSPHAVALALLGFRRAPQIRFSFLRRAGDLSRLALGSGIWVGGIEIEALDDLYFEKSTSRSL